MREITDHKVSGLNEALNLLVVDEFGAGGANHRYEVYLGEGKKRKCWEIDFQNGPIKESGFNGLSGEVLLAINIDRLRCFQQGTYACRENAIALTHLEEALMWLQKRTRERMARGVEGTMLK